MSLEAVGAAVAIAGLLVTLGVIIARASGRLATVESRVGDLGDDVKELRSAIVSLSRPRQHIRESDGEILT